MTDATLKLNNVHVLLNGLQNRIGKPSEWVNKVTLTMQINQSIVLAQRATLFFDFNWICYV